MKLPVVLGVDPALGGGCAVIACAYGEKLWVLDCRVDYGFSKTEQIFERIQQMARQYRPFRVIIEYDAQQKGIGNDDRLAAMGTLLGFEVKPHLSRLNKHMDQVFGCAAMNQSFIKSEVSIPWGDDETRRRMEPLVTQLKKWRPDLPSKQLRQDAVMAMWFCWRDWMQTKKVHEEVAEPMSVPSWLSMSPTQFLNRRAS